MLPLFDAARHLAETRGGEPEDFICEAARRLGVLHPDAIASALGGEVTGDRWLRAPSPGRRPEDRSLIVRLDDGAKYYIYAFQGHWPVVKAHVAAAIGEMAAVPPDPEEVARRRARALEIWSDTRPIFGSPGEAYLRGRCLKLPPEADEVLRWHPWCPWAKNGEVRPAMVALFRDVRTDEPVAIHRTSMNPSDSPRKKMLGPVKGAAVKLWRTPLRGRLLIGEGIETCLAATLLGDPEMEPPAWAMTSAGGVASLPLLEGVRRLTILVDNEPVISSPQGLLL